MLYNTKHLVPTLLTASLSCILLTACGGGVDSKPNITVGDGHHSPDQGSDKDKDKDKEPDNKQPNISISALQGDVTIDKYEDGEFVSYEVDPQTHQYLKYCQGVGNGVDRCGLLTYTISGGLSELAELDKTKAVTVDYELVSESGNIANILKEPTKKSGTISLYKSHLEEKLYFELKSDNKVNADWKVSLVLSNPTGGANLDSVVSDNLKAIIKDAKPIVKTIKAKINDTGVRYTGLSIGNENSCTGTSQDCNQGRDATDGNGFSFTKLDMQGKELAATATEWTCVKDNITGLIWERKTYTEDADKKDYRDLNHSYVYYNAENGLGVDKKEGSCQLQNCTTASYLNKMNTSKLCGISSWRLPNKNELFDLADLNTSESHKVLHADWLYDIPTDYASKPDSKMPSSLWTNSVAASYDQHDGYSAPYFLKFNHIWTMFTKGGLNKEDPSSSYSTAAILAVSSSK